MSVLKGLCLAIIGLSSICVSARAQWVQTSGPSGEDVRAMTALGDIAFAGTFFHGVYKTTDPARHWVPCNTGIPENSVSTLCASGSILYAGTYSGNVYESVDSGLIWAPMNTGVSGYVITTISSLGGSVFVCNSHGDIARTADEGKTWAKANPAPYQLPIYSFAVSGNSVVAASDSGIFVSADSGMSWTARSLDLTDKHVRALYSPGDGLYAGTPTGLFRSSNQGVNWAKVLDSVYVMSIVRNDTVLFVGTWYNGVFRSADSGRSWKNISVGLPDDIYLKGSLAVVGTAVMVGDNQGIAVTDDQGDRWVQINQGFVHSQVRSILAADSVIYAATNGVGMSVSSDDASRWEMRDHGLDINVINAVIQNGNEVLIGTNGGGIYSSTDQGRQWTHSAAPIPEDFVFAFGADDTITFAASMHGLFRRDGRRSSWLHIDSSARMQVISSFAYLGDYSFLAVGQAGLGGVLRSSDNGLTWPTVGSGLSTGGVTAMAVLGSTLIAASSGIYTSMDSGVSWQKIDNELSGSAVLSLYVANSLVFAGTDQGVFVSANGGENWTSISLGLSRAPVYSLSANNRFVFAATDAGVWRRPLSDLASVATHDKLNSSPQLLLTPTADGTRLNLQYFTTTDIERPKLEVCDILGKLVFTTALESAASGWNRASLALPSLPGGTYVCRVSGGGFSASGVVQIEH
jgi:photosystem II stability/assembly factor-like uncharacterized protein